MANATSKRNNGSSLGAFSFWSPEPRMSMLCRPNESFSNLRVFANEEYSNMSFNFNHVFHYHPVNFVTMAEDTEHHKA